MYKIHLDVNVVVLRINHVGMNGQRARITRVTHSYKSMHDEYLKLCPRIIALFGYTEGPKIMNNLCNQLNTVEVELIDRERRQAVVDAFYRKEVDDTCYPISEEDASILGLHTSGGVSD